MGSLLAHGSYWCDVLMELAGERCLPGCASFLQHACVYCSATRTRSLFRSHAVQGRVPIPCRFDRRFNRRSRALPLDEGSPETLARDKCFYKAATFSLACIRIVFSCYCCSNFGPS